MIKYYFHEEKEKEREMLTMITKSVEEELFDDISTREFVFSEVSKLKNFIGKMEEQMVKNDEKHEREIAEMNKEMAEKDNLINQLLAENERLKMNNDDDK